MADFQEQVHEFNQRNVHLLAASVDPLDDAQKTISEVDLTFPVGYDLNGLEVAAATGAFYDAKAGYLHATGFIIDPNGRIADALYSTGPMGRLLPRDCLRFIDRRARPAT